MSGSKIINQEKIESGERFQFIAISDTWKHQRRKRRQQAKEQQIEKNQDQHDSESPADKRIRLDTNAESIDDTKSTHNTDDLVKTIEIVESKEKNPEAAINVENALADKSAEAKTDQVLNVLKSTELSPLLHIEVNVESKTASELKAIVEVKLVYLNGTSGLDGVYGLLQYIQNKWSQ